VNFTKEQMAIAKQDGKGLVSVVIATCKGRRVFEWAFPATKAELDMVFELHSKIVAARKKAKKATAVAGANP
jgi:hypothetical protein